MPVILIVDDIAGVHEMLDIVFEDTEFTVEHALSAQDGLNIFRSKSIDVVLSDIQMPGGDGLRMLAELKQIDPEMVAIVTTASESREYVIQALRLGAFDFVQKPYEEEALLESVRRGAKEYERRCSLREIGGANIQEQLEHLREELRRKEEALEEASQKDEEINMLRHQLQARDERDLELRKRQMELEAKEGAIKTMESVIKERLEQLSKIQNDAMASGGSGGGLSMEEIEKLEQIKLELEEREVQIQEMEANLMEREASITENEEALMEKGQRLIELETELEQMREDFGKTEEDLGDAPTPEELAELDKMREEIRKKETALIEMEEQIAERERALKKSELLVRAREQFLAQSENILFGEEKSGQ